MAELFCTVFKFYLSKSILGLWDLCIQKIAFDVNKFLIEYNFT